MSDKKSSLEEARLNYQEIQKFAEEQATEKLSEQVSETLKKIFEEKLNEDTTINIDGSGNVEITTDGEVSDVDSSLDSDIKADAEMELDVDAEMGLDSPEDSEEFVVSDEDDEIKIDETIQNMEEMNDMTMEQEAAAMPAPVPAPTGEVTPEAGAAPVAETPVEAAPAMPDLLAKLDTLINIMMQQGGAPSAEGSQEFEVIDDEAAAAPAGAVAPAGPVAPEVAPPAMEEEIDIIGFEDENTIDEMEEEMLEIVDEDDSMEGPAMEETRSLGFASKRTGDKQLKMDTMEKNKGHHAPVTSLKENKAQDESKLDELIKENKSLKSTVSNLKNERKEFEEAFTDLRTQFDNMQLFNGKLALVNKVLMNGGLTTEEKIRVCEQFDGAKTHEEATRLFKNIIKENNIKVVDGKEKLKATSTNTAKPKSTTEPLYESDEARRAKKLAGITKTEDEG